MSVHPIEAESYRILAGRVDLSGLAPGPRAVVARVIHASADLEYAETMVVGEAAVDAGVAALRAGAPIVADVAMVAAGVTGRRAECCLGEVGPGPVESTRSAAAMRVAAGRHPTGAVVVVGCAPTALVEAVRLALDGTWAPAVVVGLPVGFVGAAEAKRLVRESGLPSITNVGEKGGSAVAAAVVAVAAVWIA